MYPGMALKNGLFQFQAKVYVLKHNNAQDEKNKIKRRFMRNKKKEKERKKKRGDIPIQCNRYYKLQAKTYVEILKWDLCIQS